MQRGHVLGEPVVLEHVQQGRFAGIVQTEEQQFAGLLPQACARKLYKYFVTVIKWLIELCQYVPR